MENKYYDEIWKKSKKCIMKGKGRHRDFFLE